MQKILGLLCLISLLLLTACSSGAALQPAESGNVTVVEDSAEMAGDSDGPDAETADTEAAEVTSAPVLSGPTDDITLIGATGRPQFLNTYADW